MCKTWLPFSIQFMHSVITPHYHYKNGLFSDLTAPPLLIVANFLLKTCPTDLPFCCHWLLLFTISLYKSEILLYLFQNINDFTVQSYCIFTITRVPQTLHHCPNVTFYLKNPTLFNKLSICYLLFRSKI